MTVIKIEIRHAQTTGVLGGGANATATLDGDGSAPVSTVPIAESKASNCVDGVAAGVARHGSRHSDIDFSQVDKLMATG